MPTQNVNLTEHQHNLIKELVASGRYQNASEVVRAALRLIEEYEQERERKEERFWAEIQKGYDDYERDAYTTLKSRQDIRDYIDGIRSGDRETVVRESDAGYQDQ